jgi:hypothetical protein
VFSHVGGYQSGVAFTRGTTTAVWVGAAVVLGGAVAAAFIPRRRRVGEALEPAFEAV